MKLNALEALKLAKETGAKVRPKGCIPMFYLNGKLHLSRPFVGPRRISTLDFDVLINDDGSPVEWEVLREGAPHDTH